RADARRGYRRCIGSGARHDHDLALSAARMMARPSGPRVPAALWWMALVLALGAGCAKDKAVANLPALDRPPADAPRPPGLPESAPPAEPVPAPLVTPPPAAAG